MSQSPAKEKIKGVQWFKHFPTNFVRPYGPTVVHPTDQTIWNRLQTFNCELLQRPKVGVSELAGSIEGNLNSLANSNYKLVNHKKLKTLMEHLQGLTQSLKPLEKGSGEQLNEKHVVNMLKEFYQLDDDSLSMVHEAFVVGSTLYTMAIQLLTCNAIFHDPEQYARTLAMIAVGAKAFKDNPSVKAMKRFLLENIVTSTTEGTPTKHKSCSLLAELQDSADDLLQTTDLLSQNLNSSDNLSDPDSATTTSAVNTRKRSIETVLSDLEDEESAAAKKAKKKKKRNKQKA